MYRVTFLSLTVAAILVLPQMLLAEDGRKRSFDPQEIFQKIKQADKDQDGKLSKEEVSEHMRPHFDKVDTDKSGYLEKPEIRRAVHGMMVFMRLKQADKDNDEKLSKEEAPQRMKTHFDKIDKNGDGLLDYEELKPVIERIVKHAGDRGPGKGHEHKGRHGHGDKDKEHHGHKGHGEMFKRLKAADKDNDGRWSKEEAPDRMKEHFEKIDANSDGLIDKEEIKAAFKAQMKEMHQKHAEGSNKKE